jgi:hypothetical protein
MVVQFSNAANLHPKADMNTQEREQLTRFLQQLTQAQLAQKDSDADRMIREACLGQPDAAYLLVQRAMLLDQTVQDSQAKISRLQDELNQARSGNSSGTFLDANAWGNSAVTQPGLPLQAPHTAGTVAPAAGAMAPAPAPSAWGAGMLGNIATTAAGVVAGGFLFQGIGHLLGNNNAHADPASPANSLSSANEIPASPPRTDDRTNTTETSTTGVFDTSSVDSYIADNTESSDDNA